MSNTNENFSDSPMEKIGPYQLIRVIGKGGMGEIFLAKDPICERTIALKKILPRLLRYPSIKKRFLNEAKIAAQLAHPSIISIYSLCTDENQIYYTMPYIKGETLKEILKKTRQEKEPISSHPIGSSIPTLIRLFLSVCQAIDYTHANRFLHRDIKPENIIIGKFGEVMILDWGIAHRMDEEENREDIPTPNITDLTKPGRVVGTVSYMAPERAFGHPSTVQTDIYSLGVLLYQLLTLRLPFNRPSLKDFKKNAVKEKWVDPQEVAPHRDIPLKLAQLAKKCLHPNHHYRLQSVREIIAELEDYIEGRPAWIPSAKLSPTNPSDWEFQENVPLAKHMAISRLASSIEWVMLMISQNSYSGNTKIEANVQLRSYSSGIGFLLCIPDAKEREGLEEGYLIWIGSTINPGCKLFRSNVEMITNLDASLSTESIHSIVIEKSEQDLRLFIDNTLVLNYMSHLPLIGGHIGLLSRDASFHIEEIAISLGSQNAMVNCLAIPDAFLMNKDYPKALREYRNIAHSFQGRVEAREALFRAGITLFEEAKSTVDAEKQEALFVEALDEFEKLHGTPGAPLEYLGKSFIYRMQHSLDEEIKCLELALRKYPKHPLLPLLEERIIFRLHEAAQQDRQAAYSFLLLALRQLPKSLTSKETKQLMLKLTSNEENPFFIETPSSFSQVEVEHLYLAIKLSFYLSKPAILYEISQKIRNEYKEASLLIGNILFALLEMGYTDLMEYIWEHLHSDTWKNSLSTAAFLLKKKDTSPVDLLEEMIQMYPNPKGVIEKRCFYHLFLRALKIEKASLLLPFFEKLPIPSFLPLHLWALLLAKESKKAAKLFTLVKEEELHDRSSPYYLLYGCYLTLAKGEKAGLGHFHPLVELRYPPISALLSYYLLDQSQLKTNWLQNAFLYEKIALYDQLALYFCCLKEEEKAKEFELLADKEKNRQRQAFHFP